MFWLLLACTPREADPVVVEVEAGPALREQAPRNAVLIVVDTLRADVLERAASPNIDSLAQARVGRAWGAGTWTVPSVISLFTGLPVREHGWDLPTGKMGRYPALPAHPTLAEVLQQEGFTTTGLYANTYLAEELGFDRGFDRWRRVSDAVMAKELAKELERSWAPEGRNFLYLHLLGPHSPLKPSPEAMERHGFPAEPFEGRLGLEIGAAKRDHEGPTRELYAQAYQAVVEDTDARIGELLALLEPYREDTVIVLTSDHGELLGEHDVVGHGYWLWEPLTHVPLVAWNAGELPATGSIALVPELLTRNLGVAHAWPEEGTRPLPLVSQREGKLALSPDGVHKGVWHDAAAPESFQVFDLEADPGERIGVEDVGLQLARGEWEARVPRAEPLVEEVELQPETQEGLKELGYLR